jgi:hypothetical protein
MIRERPLAPACVAFFFWCRWQTQASPPAGAGLLFVSVDVVDCNGLKASFKEAFGRTLRTENSFLAKAEDTAQKDSRSGQR